MTGSKRYVEIESAFEEFLKANKCSSVEAVEPKVSAKKKRDDNYVISKPWGDQTLEIMIPDDRDEFQSLCIALNTLYLPRRFSAVVHRDTQIMEVIWTAYELKPAIKDIANREFHFYFLGQNRLCRFGEASQELLTVAKNTVPRTQPNHTDHRNIVSLHFYSKGVEVRRLSKPISFFIECSDLDADAVVDLAKHLNAYMSYYDNNTPRILIHEEEVREPLPTRSRFIKGKFPKSIRSRQIDPNLISYWNEVNNTSNFIMRYLLCYRILEYASFSYIEPQLRSGMKRLLAQPDALNDVDGLVNSIYEATVIANSIDEINRMQNLIGNAVQLDILWTEIERCDDFFRDDTVFEGGFTVKKLLSKEEGFETWKNNGVRNLLDRFRMIRNALAHGQDQKTRLTIRPSLENTRLIGPWLNLIEVCSAETMLYRDIV